MEYFAQKNNAFVLMWPAWLPKAHSLLKGAKYPNPTDDPCGRTPDLIRTDKSFRSTPPAITEYETTRAPHNLQGLKSAYNEFFVEVAQLSGYIAQPIDHVETFGETKDRLPRSNCILQSPSNSRRFSRGQV